MSETPVTTIASQFFHAAQEPLDKSEQVATFADLSDPYKIAPYRGKIVHVQDDSTNGRPGGTIYICAKGPADGQPAVWRPILSDDGLAFYITNVKPNGTEEVYTITAVRDGDGKGRLQVTYPDA